MLPSTLVGKAMQATTHRIQLADVVVQVRDGLLGGRSHAWGRHLQPQFKGSVVPTTTLT